MKSAFRKAIFGGYSDIPFEGIKLQKAKMLQKNNGKPFVFNLDQGSWEF